MMFNYKGTAVGSTSRDTTMVMSVMFRYGECDV